MAVKAVDRPNCPTAVKAVDHPNCLVAVKAVEVGYFSSTQSPLGAWAVMAVNCPDCPDCPGCHVALTSCFNVKIDRRYRQFSQVDKKLKVFKNCNLSKLHTIV